MLHATGVIQHGRLGSPILVTMRVVQRGTGL